MRKSLEAIQSQIRFIVGRRRAPSRSRSTRRCSMSSASSRRSTGTSITSSDSETLEVEFEEAGFDEDLPVPRIARALPRRAGMPHEHHAALGGLPGEDYAYKGVPVCYNGLRGQRQRDLAQRGKIEIKGLGLVSMRERVEHMGGSFQIRSSPGKGTRIRVKIPIEARHANKTTSDSRGRSHDRPRRAASAPRGERHRGGRRGGGWARGGEARQGAQVPMLVIMDIVLPRLGGIEAARSIRQGHARHKGHHAHDPRRAAVRLQIAGGGREGVPREGGAARGAHERDQGRHERGDLPQLEFSRRACSSSYAKMAKRGKKADEFSQLTKREREILQYIAEGYTSPQIAKMLFISKKTVENHRANIMEKLEHTRYRRARPLRDKDQACRNMSRRTYLLHGVV